ncbi:uncharacterized protein PGTG_16351 [Puccinia graminis f. sp. tritici CRL 75-36-700-3]|uniref:Uncharacterized protein n=1 Tax=Puccinia graminis f. sp. tritici (strain CRL 75-36-700-3 / race SCCL) TaxID=418459 RepID=E3L151_PUCGT|nr:uncharacterized protein PGTG_16351 [Puccinia graminis f. sp. tritici CRL 75-36-700-3]EFP90325.1 hypothetical protein PGTG_16351 [Puccinia graminis f. sp. tritici CRL 75-36-700-3]
MPISKAGRSQRPIEITDDNEPIFVRDGTFPAKVFEIYDNDVALVDESHHIMAWCEDPDESGSKNEESQDVVEFLWPISFGNNREPPKRNLNSGRSQYLIPMANPDSDSNKVVPRKLPRTTKHHYKMKGINAVGKNNNIMSNFLQKGKDQMNIGVEEELTESSTTTSQNHPPPSRAMDNRREYDQQINLRGGTLSCKSVEACVTPQAFHKHAVNVVLPRHGYKGISLDTATRWMYKLGFWAQYHQKSVYYGGHEREDVVASRKKYLDNVAQLRVYLKKYDGENCEIPLLVDPKILGHNKETVFIYHDESTIHAKERPTLSWLLPGTTELQSKSLGRLIHISDFILESTGRLVLSPEEQTLNQLKFSDAAKVIYPGSQGDAWWDMDQLCKQVSEKAIPIFEASHPKCQGVFVFDCSLAHEAFGPSALRAQKMNLGPGGKQSHLRDTVIPSNDPHIPEVLQGQPQMMCYPSNHLDPSLDGQPKGIKQVLTERGLWQYYSGTRNQARLPPLNLKCKQCLASGAVKEAKA